MSSAEGGPLMGDTAAGGTNKPEVVVGLSKVKSESEEDDEDDDDEADDEENEEEDEEEATMTGSDDEPAWSLQLSVSLKAFSREANREFGLSDAKGLSLTIKGIIHLSNTAFSLLETKPNRLLTSLIS